MSHNRPPSCRARRARAGCLVRPGRWASARCAVDSVPAAALRGRSPKSDRGGSGAPRSAPAVSHVAAARRGHGDPKFRSGCGALGASAAGRSRFDPCRAGVDNLARPGVRRPQRAGLARARCEFRAIDFCRVLDVPPTPAFAPTRCRSQAAYNGRRIRPARLARLGAVPGRPGDARDQDSVRARLRSATKSRRRLEGVMASRAVPDACCNRQRTTPRSMRV